MLPTAALRLEGPRVAVWQPFGRGMIRNKTDMLGVEQHRRRLEAPREWWLAMDQVSGGHPGSLTGHSSFNLRIRGDGLARIAPWAVK